MRDDCVISEQNFFDEEDKPMSFKDILEGDMPLSHTTLFDDYGNLYFADHDYTDAYDEWTLADGALTMTTANALEHIIAQRSDNRIRRQRSCARHHRGL